MSIKSFIYYFLVTVFTVIGSHLKAQEINWLNFEQLEDSLKVQPKPVFIDFYSSWCTYCRKMDKVVFTKSEIINILNTNYYAVRMDAESTDSIYFDDQLFVNKQAENKRNGFHQIAMTLGQRNNQFIPPTLIVLNKDFTVRDRYFIYLDSKKLLQSLEKNEQITKGT